MPFEIVQISENHRTLSFRKDLTEKAITYVKSFAIVLTGHNPRSKRIILNDFYAVANSLCKFLPTPSN